MSSGNDSIKGVVVGIVAVLVLVVGVIALSMWGIPKYRIYKQDLRGQATLREAEWTKKVKIEDAKAERDSAVLFAEKEITRAKGLAEAQKIIDGTLTERYLRFLWIQGLQDGSSEVIYIATEAGMPILEAGKRVLPNRKQLAK
jgi:hypothetical protein